MKKILFIALLSVTVTVTHAQNKSKMNKQIIETLIRNYASAVDAQDVAAAEKFLDKDFRVVLNNYNNSGSSTILSREQYTGMMKTGKVGGNKRELRILFTDVHEAAAVVKVEMKGEKTIFTNYYSLINANGQWLIIHDIPQLVAINN
jgi:ketosteroid isomerase-like protein